MVEQLDRTLCFGVIYKELKKRKKAFARRMQEDPVLYKMGSQDNNKVFSNANKQHVEQACSI